MNTTDYAFLVTMPISHTHSADHILSAHAYIIGKHEQVKVVNGLLNAVQHVHAL